MNRRLWVFLIVLAACGRSNLTTRTPSPPSVPTPATLSPTLDAESATLASLERIDDYPLYTMRYVGDYRRTFPEVSELPGRWVAAWACSLFAALGDPDSRLYGRNFDWQYSPALLLFTNSPDGYASVSMVDIGYLVDADKVGDLTELPLDERQALLYAPLLPFDGMNERGLVIGMAAVPPGNVPPHPNKETIDSLMVMREVLDHAQDVDEAVAILQSYNVDWGSGPPLHYLVADRSGQAMLVEFYTGQIVFIPNAEPWHQATNFLRASVGESAEGQCWRYDRIHARLAEVEGRLTTQGAMDLLSRVSQESTQWSVVYDMSAGGVSVAMGRAFDRVYTFSLTDAALPLP